MLDDLLWTKPRTVGGVLFVRPPTVRMFFRVLKVFGTEVASLRQAARLLAEKNIPLSPAIAVSHFLIKPDDWRFLYVFEDVLHPRLLPKTQEGWRKAAMALIEILGPNLARIETILGDPEADLPSGKTTGDDVLIVLAYAERFGLRPIQVMDEPVGTLLDVYEGFSKRPLDEIPDAEVAQHVGSIIGGPIEGTGVVGGPEPEAN